MTHPDHDDTWPPRRPSDDTPPGGGDPRYFGTGPDGASRHDDGSGASGSGHGYQPAARPWAPAGEPSSYGPGQPGSPPQTSPPHAAPQQPAAPQAGSAQPAGPQHRAAPQQGGLPQQQVFGPLPPPPPLAVPQTRRPFGQAPTPATDFTTGVPTTGAPVTEGGRAGRPDQAARGLSAPAVTAAPLATGQTVAGALAAHELGHQGPPPDGSTADADAEARTGLSGRMTGLQIGWHTVTRAALRRMSLSPATAGLVIGHDRQQDPVPVRLFAPEPVRVALVGGVWAAQLLIFRALAVGARVAVVTTEPTAWIGFGERATGQYNRVTVLTGDQPIAVSGTAQQPILAVYDLGSTGPATAPPLGPWRTQLTILRQLDKPGVPALQEAQLTLLQRLGGDEAALVGSALRLRRHSGQFLQFMADDMIALIGDGTERYLWLAQTPTEQQHAGLPRR